MENNNNAAANSNVNTEVNNSPAGANAGTEKTFTQEEVNNIVQERLARERAKNEPTPAELREKELTARENTLQRRNTRVNCLICSIPRTWNNSRGMLRR